VAGIRSRGFPEESLTSYKSVHEMVVKGPHLWHKARREGAEGGACTRLKYARIDGSCIVSIFIIKHLTLFLVR